MGNIYGNQETPVETVNPWTAIWSTPRKTIRSAIDNPNMKLVLLLVMASGVIGFIDQAISQNMGDSMPFLLVLGLALVAGVITGFISWWILSGLATFIGKWFGGVGTYRDMKIAVGITYIPVALSGVLYIFDLLFLGQSLFMDVDISIPQVMWLMFSSSIGVVLSVWGFFILIKGVAEVHRFSAWKGFWTVIMPFVFVMFLVLLLVLVI